MLAQIKQDLGFSVRTLRRSSGFAVLVITGLALGISANAAIFSLIDAVSIRQLPVPHPDELIALGLPENVEGNGAGTPGAAMYSYPLYKDVRDRNDVLSGLAATGFAGHVAVRADTGGSAANEEAEHPKVRFVSGNFFSVLGVGAARGRTLEPADDTPGATPAATISYSYWTRRFANDPTVIGRTMLVGDNRVVVTGVAARTFDGEVVGSSTDMWLPVAAHDVVESHQQVLNDRTAMWLLLIGRMKPGVTFEQARARLVPTVRQSILAAATGRQLRTLATRPIEVAISPASRGLSEVRVTFSRALETLMAGVAILLCIVCVNVANLLLARGVARRREMALRAALGAERARLLRQLLTESLVIAFVAAAAAVLVAWWVSHALVLLAMTNEPLSLSVDPNLDTLLFTIAVAVASVLIFGVAPALRASRVDLVDGLRVGRSVAGGARFGRGLIAAQVALSLVLVAGAFSLMRGVQRSLRTPLGLDRDHLVVAKLDIEARGLVGTPLANVVHAVQDRVSAIPGVAAVTFSENGLFDDTRWSAHVDVPGTAPRTSDDSLAATDGVGAGYARAIGATIVAGRDLTPADEAANARAVLVNQTFANSYFHNEPAVGRTLRFGPRAEFEIVGVVADIRAQSLDAPRGHYARQVFWPYLHGDDTTRLGQPSELRLIVRTSGDPARLVPDIRRAIAAAAPTLSIERAEPLTDLVRGSIRAERLLSEIATALGAFALSLAALGLFSVMSYSVAQRTNEVGIRIALGASAATVRRMIVSQALAPVVWGVGLGTPVVFLSLRLLAHEVPTTATIDPVAVSIGAAMLLLTGAAAAALPAHRASRIDPIETLKGE